MRKLACFLLLCGGIATVPATEMWRWKDANGVVHYSDRPMPGAERIGVSAPKPGSVATPAPVARTVEPAPVEYKPYTRCFVTNPVNDQVFANLRTVPVNVLVEPNLQGDHRMEVLINGKPVQGWPGSAVAYTLKEVERGSHTLSVRVVDPQGKVHCNGSGTTFHVRMPSVLAPVRQTMKPNTNPVRPPAPKP